MSTTGRKLVRRACDGCKIRKIKCTEATPCDGCVAAGIACTFVKQPSTRGPRRLRRSTLCEIAQSQQQWRDLGFSSTPPAEPVVHTKLDSESVFAPNKVAALVLQLCVYRLRMYPVWPIIKVERLVASLQKSEPDIEVFGLAYAVAAATIIQIRTKPSTQPGAVTAEMMEAQCLYAKAQRKKEQPPDLTTVRIPFFLHMYYENLEPGGLRSLTCLREAIAVAHMVGLHREMYYSDVQPEEREIRRRTLWLLFVAERKVSITHKLPVTIKCKIVFPGTVDSDSEHVLAAFKQLVVMFWDFDRSGVFELLDQHNFDFDLVLNSTLSPSISGAIGLMRQTVNNSTVNMDNIEDSQAFDLLVTRQWMLITFARLLDTSDIPTPNSERSHSLAYELVKIARNLLLEITPIPESAIEAHSSFFESKILDIMTAIVDAINKGHQTLPLDNGFVNDAIEILSQLRRLLSRSRDVDNRWQRFADSIIQRPIVTKSPSTMTSVPSTESNTSWWPLEDSPSSTEFGNGALSTVSPGYNSSEPRDRQISLLESPNSLESGIEPMSIHDSMDQSYLDIDWPQECDPSSSAFPGEQHRSWHDAGFVFNKS